MSTREHPRTTRAHRKWEDLAWSGLEALALTLIVGAGIVAVIALAALLS